MGSSYQPTLHQPHSQGGRAFGSANILASKPQLDWDDDAAADVLYISIEKPRPALGVVIGDGVIVKWDKRKREVVGHTIIGLRARLAEGIKQK
jgi:uncharacterized protein YuzE